MVPCARVPALSGTWTRTWAVERIWEHDQDQRRVWGGARPTAAARLGAELARQRPGGLAHLVAGVGVGRARRRRRRSRRRRRPTSRRPVLPRRPRRAPPRPAPERCRSSHLVQLAAYVVGRGERLAGHAAQLAVGEHPLGLVGLEGEHRLAQSAGVGRDHDAHLGHLPAPVGPRLVVDDHDVVDQQHAGTDREARSGGRGPRPTGSPWTAARGCRGRRCRAAAPPARAGSGWSRAPAPPSRAPRGVRTMPCVVDGARSSRAASSDRLIRRAPWSAVSTRMARSTDWITGQGLRGE